MPLGITLKILRGGRIDYLLLDSRNFPLVALEAKAESKHPLAGKEQAREYATSQKCRFIILSNGNEHYFWDPERGNPYKVVRFPTPESIKDHSRCKPNPERLVNEKIGKDYIALTQMPRYSEEPSWQCEENRSDFIDKNGLRFLRNYQLNAVRSIKEAVKENKTRFLFEMATGTGKTLTSAAVIKLFLKSGNASRVLFLVDRLELEDQAWKAFTRTLKNDYKTLIFKESRNDWQSAEIVVTTVQSLSFNNKFKDFFSPTDFDFIISDESHRSINGNRRAVFEYFVGYKLGLTATPRV